ncbi:MAG: LytR/AlgR family response regulator transcription factor [Lewinella sp.]|uniref:LytR/AlgR family response regulator transcription factor n=1 Tax=Lewinella sp. TaxID=2004506 RepID=UPI003D6B2558
MQAFSVAIIDDNSSIRKLIRQLLRQNFPQLKIIAEAGGVREGIVLLEDKQPDILFLDMELGDGMGFELLEMVGESSTRVIVISAFESYAYHAIHADITDYLLKPISAPDLRLAVLKASKQLEQQRQKEKEGEAELELSDDRLVLRTATSFHLIVVDDIVYCHSEAGYSTFFLKDERKIVISKTLKAVEEILNGFLFFRIHKSYLLNCRYMQSFHKTGEMYIVLSSGERLPVASRKKEAFTLFLLKMRNL